MSARRASATPDTRRGAHSAARAALALALALTLALTLWPADDAAAQGTSYYHDMHFDPFQRQLYDPGRVRPHSTIRDHNLDELRPFFDPDSVIYLGVRKLARTRAKVINDFVNTDFLSWPWRGEKKPVYVALNPLFDLQLGLDANQKDNHRTWVNSRGLYVNGNLGRNFWFYVDLTENQAEWPAYFDNLCDSLHSIPGLGNYKGGHRVYDNDYDFETSDGYICWNIGPHVNFLVGKTRAFIGDGYRSLLLGDHTNSMPTFRLNLTFLRVKYTFMATQLRSTHYTTKKSNIGMSPKYSFTHFLDCNIGRRFTLGIFENVTQASWRNDGSHRGVDWEYLNPFVVFRPGEFNAGSPDKMIIGLTAKFIVQRWLTAYGQFLVNEFRVKELFAGTGFWSNKLGFQFGLRGTDIFKVPGLDFLGEFNYLRPYCYSQFENMGSYTHHALCLGHPLGANLVEGLGLVSYRRGRLQARVQVNAARYGDDFPGDSLSYGHNPEMPSFNRAHNYGVKMFQGVDTRLLYFDAEAAWVVNPRSLLNLAAGFRYRRRESDLCDEVSKHVWVALRWSLKGHYYDY